MKYVLISCLLVLTGTNLFADVIDSISSQGEMRSFRVHLPNNTAPSSAVPLIIALHGLGDNMNNFSGIGFSQLANSDTFIVVYPQGDNLVPLGNGWRIGSPIDGSYNDVQFIADLMDTLEARYLIDADRVYATGFSMGGFMTHLLACELNDRIAAIASHSGTMGTAKVSVCNAARTTPVMHIHGTGDATIDYNGGTFFSVFPYQGAEFMTTMWANIDSCNTPPDSTRLPDIRNDGYTVDEFQYTGCLDSTEVILVRVNGLPHTWMQASNDWNATPEIWNFFKRHTLADRDTSRYSTPDTSTNGIFTTNIGTAELNLYPNPTNGQVTLDIQLAGHANLEIYNALGELVEDRTMVSSKSTVDLSNAGKGLYLVKLTDPDTGHTLTSRKLLVQ